MTAMANALVGREPGALQRLPGRGPRLGTPRARMTRGPRASGFSSCD